MTILETPAHKRRHSFTGARLSCASLAGSDLRGSDFTAADLHGADLSNIRSGMSRVWTVVVVVGSLALSILLGIAVGFSAVYLRSMYENDDARYQMAALYVGASLAVLLVAGIWRGLGFAIKNVAPVTVSVVVAGGLIAVITGTGTGVAAIVALAFVVVAAAAVALCVVVRAVAGIAGNLMFALVAISGGLASGAVGGRFTGAAVAIGAMVMARRSATLESNPVMARVLAAIACRGGTRFRHANLAGANLEHAHLVACDFRGANLSDARFAGATMKMCRFETPPLDKSPS